MFSHPVAINTIGSVTEIPIMWRNALCTPDLVKQIFILIKPMLGQQQWRTSDLNLLGGIEIVYKYVSPQRQHPPYSPSVPFMNSNAV